MAGSASKEGFDGEGTRSVDGASEPSQLAPDRQLGPGDVLRGKYRIERLIGEGGMGSVWQAQHLQLDLPVALKLLRAERDKALLTERLKVEARAAARLVHPAIVRVFDIDATESGEPFIVMELLDGESLAELLDRGRLSGVSAVQTLLPIAEALSLAHNKGIIHRDIKPHNVFLAKDGERLQPKLLDFGIAKLTGAAQRPGNLTDTGVAVGSPDYMSPEQARGQNDLDYRADIWQFSVVLYEAVAGRTPYDGDNYNALMRSIVEDEPAPLWLGDSVDQRLSELIFWGLAKDRALRPESMQELGRALAQWLIDRGVQEDVCSSPLHARWITRSAQRSIPVVQLENVEPTQAPPPPSSAPTDTLVSARDPKVARRAQAQSASPVLDVPGRALLRPWLLGITAVVSLIGVGWALARAWAPPTVPQRVEPAGSTLDVVAVTSGKPAEIAATPAVHSSIDSTSVPPPHHSASASASASPPARPREVREVKAKATEAPAAKPAPVRHDDTPELLQAY